ncbi:MAG TPA: 30S ribosomal protein S14 [Candidatus Norongarragalinales archaeon]|nr:30S ribosomal protein S14 [Candidatus Norongarragalinales archaeon]
MQKLETKYKHRGKRRCSMCGNCRGLIQKYDLYICRKCFREHATELGFEKYG